MQLLSIYRLIESDGWSARSSSMSSFERGVINTAIDVCSKVPGVSRIFLFGSRARNNFREDSDFDFIVLMSTPVTNSAMGIPLSRSIAEISGTEHVDVICEMEPTREQMELARKAAGTDDDPDVGMFAHAVHNGFPVKQIWPNVG